MFKFFALREIFCLFLCAAVVKWEVQVTLYGKLPRVHIVHIKVHERGGNAMRERNDAKVGFYVPKKEAKKHFRDELESAPKHRSFRGKGLIKRAGVLGVVLTATAFVLTNRDKSR